jgi:N-acetylglucosaminyldiphosphoundecaprenol N-acetyl-beta-D-mannosaminyltransferase
MKLHQTASYIYKNKLSDLSSNKLLINTLNAHSFNTAQSDEKFQIALLNSDILIPDGISVVWAVKWLTGRKLKKIAGADLFFYEMERINMVGGKCFFMGSSDDTLKKILNRSAQQYPNVKVFTYSPPYKPEFTHDENKEILDRINAVQPDVLFVGMTAPRQEKWAHQHFNVINAGHVCCIGAVFDFYAGTVKRAPNWMISIGLEWLYRLLKEPRRMWKRYIIGNILFVFLIINEKIECLKNK